MKSSAGLLILPLMVCVLVACNKPKVEPPLPPMAALDPASQSNIQNARAAVLKAGNDVRAWGAFALLLRAYGFHAEARTCFLRAEALDPKDPRWPYFLARAPDAREPAESLRWLRRTVEICGNDPIAPRYYLARILTEENHWKEAEKEIGQLLAARQGFPPALLLQAQLELSRTNPAAAIALLERCASDPQTSKSAFAFLATVRQEQGDPSGAAEAAEFAAALPPDRPIIDPFEAQVTELRDDVRVLAERIHQLLAARDLTAAAPLAERLQREYPRAPETWLVLGRLRLLQGDVAAAEQALRTHLELQPDSAQGIFQLGLVYLNSKQFEAAASTFGDAIRLKPDFGPAWFNQAFALASSGNFPEAIQAFREAIRCNPEHVDSYLLLADLHLRSNGIAAASNLLNQAVSIQPDHPGVPSLRRKLESIGRR